MSSDRMHSTPTPRWSDPTQCPFCQLALPDAGAGFIDHLDESPRCQRGFDAWRMNIAGDMSGEWTG
ncbi:DUF7501 family protein [Haloferacaceae archaeon DSL9]